MSAGSPWGSDGLQGSLCHSVCFSVYWKFFKFLNKDLKDTFQKISLLGVTHADACRNPADSRGWSFSAVWSRKAARGHSRPLGGRAGGLRCPGISGEAGSWNLRRKLIGI